MAVLSSSDMNLSWCTETLNPPVEHAQETVWHMPSISPNDQCWSEWRGHLPKGEGYRQLLCVHIMQTRKRYLKKNVIALKAPAEGNLEYAFKHI